MAFSNPRLTCPDCATDIALSATGPWLGAALACSSCGWRPSRQDGFPLFAPALAETGSDFDVAGFDRLAAVEPWHFWFGPRARLLSRLVTRHFPEAGSFLEIGCGTGFVTRAVMAAQGWQHVLAGEVAVPGLGHAARLLPPEVELLQIDARAMPFRDAFDVIGCFDVLEHIAEDQLVLEGLAKALRPGGGLVPAVPQHMWLWSSADDHAHHKRRYGRGELEERCRRAGLDIVASLSYAVVTLPLLLASRFVSRRVSETGGAPEELAPPPWLNATLKGALRAEVSLSLAGLHWPFGGSRIVVARRPC